MFEISFFWKLHQKLLSILNIIFDNDFDKLELYFKFRDIFITFIFKLTSWTQVILNESFYFKKLKCILKIEYNVLII